MNDDHELKLDIQKDIKELAGIIGRLTIKYEAEPLLSDAQKAFTSLSVKVGRALDIQLQ